MSDMFKATVAETPDEDPRKNKVTVRDTQTDRSITLESTTDTVTDLEFAGYDALKTLINTNE